MGVRHSNSTFFVSEYSDTCGSKDIQEEGTVGERSVSDLVTAKVVPRTFVRSRKVY